jgi:8-oxo-dGTP pyrophosphatase MutT (NUDIX family)
VGNPKHEIRGGLVIHYSVGVLVREGDNVLLIDRNTPPYGWAGLAGHQDEGEDPTTTALREVNEESGLTLHEPKLIDEHFLPWNACSKGVTGHHWYLYEGRVSGKTNPSPREVRAIAWQPLERLPELALEPAWEFWFRRLGLL